MNTESNINSNSNVNSRAADTAPDIAEILEAASFSPRRSRRAKERQETGAPVFCRAVAVTISRNKGVPMSAALSPGLTNLMASEEALMGVGLMGESSSGSFARMGIYCWDGVAPKLRGVVNFDREGLPLPGGRQLSEPESALLNWVTGLLFSNAEPGNYALKIDRKGDGELPAPYDVRPFPRRFNFAIDRSTPSRIEMADRNLEKYGDGGRLEVAKAVKFMSGLRAQTDGWHPATLCKEAFRQFAVHKINGALRTPTGDFRDIKAFYMKAFEVADNMKRMDKELSARSLESTVTKLREMVAKHISQSPETAEWRGQMEVSLRAAVEALRCYWTLEKDGEIPVFTELRPTDDEPMFTAVSPVPAQVVDGFMSSGHLPFEGLDFNDLK